MTKKRRMQQSNESTKQTNDHSYNQSDKQLNKPSNSQLDKQSDDQSSLESIDRSFGFTSSRTIMTLLSVLGLVCLCALINQSISQSVNETNLTSQSAAVKPIIKQTINQAPLSLTFQPTNSRIIRNAACFTQGIYLSDGYVYESCGMYGESKLVKIHGTTRKVVKSINLDNKYFAEGLTVLNDRIYLLTWREHVCLVYNLDLELIEQFEYPHDGWGITHSNNQLIVSDGSDSIRFYDESFKLLNTVKVREYQSSNKQFKSIKNINELEVIDGQLWANQWMTNKIYVINLSDNQSNNQPIGQVVATIDCSSLVKIAGGDLYNKVLNGIAFNQTDQSVWITGKLWPMAFIIDKPVIGS